MTEVAIPWMDPERPLVERLRLAADAGFKVRTSDMGTLMTEVADVLDSVGPSPVDCTTYGDLARGVTRHINPKTSAVTEVPW